MYRILQAKLLLGSKIDRYVVKKANLKRQVQKGKKGGSCTSSCTSISRVSSFKNSRRSPPFSSSSSRNCCEPSLKYHECLICKDSWDLKDDLAFGLDSSSSCIKYKLINKKGYIHNIKITTYQRNCSWVPIIHLFLLLHLLHLFLSSTPSSSLITPPDLSIFFFIHPLVRYCKHKIKKIYIKLFFYNYIKFIYFKII